MPTAGLSLLGFLDRDLAIQFLRNTCVPDEAADDASLEQEWQAAQGRLGSPLPSAGRPEILAFPASHLGYLTALTQTQWVSNAFQGQQVTFGMVEIDPLLAFQFHVDTSRTDHHCASFSSPPSLDEMLAVALPLNPPTEEFHIQQQAQSVVIRSRSLNLGTRMQGMLNHELAGIHFNLSLPLLHVVRFNGRCYLHNGFHRTYGIRRAGGTHIPCVIRDVQDAPSAGIRSDGGTFSQAILESSNPPTVGHYTQNRAHSVNLRRVARLIHVSWAEYVVPEE